MDVIGVTGTNGKTTTVHLIERLYAGLGFKTGRIGTLGVRIGDFEEEGAHTTPEAPDLQRTLRKMADAGVQKVAVEVSSHALAQDRTWGTVFSTVVFTNLTQDHLDYHKDMEEYFEAKKRLFTEYEPKDVLDHGEASINMDDAYGRRLATVCKRGICGYGIHEGRVRATGVHPLSNGSEFTLQFYAKTFPVRLRLPGLFNVYNALAALTAVHHDSGLDTAHLLMVLESLTGAPGRFEAVDEGQDFAVLVDYAHTPDALENVLKAAREITPDGRVIAVFGCGGDRDRTKRPKMGHIGGELSDLAFVTSDNPRTEEPGAIIEEVVAGMSGQHNFTTDADRRAAILAAIAEARTGDTVVIAGKGHEDYQIVGTEKHHFDDREIAREALSARRSRH
jgi:UDP-N-acetylmuramoyl-L-alanyl-D-glutamate--2,6-diaminopimelate ligase